MHQLQETSKSKEQLQAELVNLVKLVTKFIEEQSWQQQATGQSAEQSDKFKEAFISQLGFYELVQILDWPDQSVAYPALQLINQVCEKNLEKQRMMCVAGVLPHLKRFCDVQMPREIKVEVAYFIGQLFQYSRELLGLFVASQGHLIQI